MFPSRSRSIAVQIRDGVKFPARGNGVSGKEISWKNVILFAAL